MLPQNMKYKLEELVDFNFDVQRVGTPTLQSKITDAIFVDDSERIAYCADPLLNDKLKQEHKAIPAFVAAGPRRMLFHDAPWTRAAIATCGGLCPGLNDVIKALVNTLYYIYGVDNIFGIPYGYMGLNPASGLKPIVLDPDVVDNIHTEGGSILGSSRGEQPVEEMVKTLDRLNINILFTIGGDGTQRGAHALAEEIKKHKLPISVIGVPKTIDNDLNFMDKTFGFETAVEAAVPVISCAHNEAKGCYNGIGLIKLMGRDSGFIAANASLANSLVNFCLIPEVPFELEGPHGLLQALERRLEQKHHAVIVAAEGAGQNLFDSSQIVLDKSGNKLHQDIGTFLKDRISNHLKEKKIDFSLKYIDPSYIIRSMPATGTDSTFCLHLAQNAVHAAMAGMTDIVVGNWQGYFTYVPIELATKDRRKIDPQGQLWQSVLLTTRQNKYLEG
ncbi:MAG: ATP-dependent 6-phosphofructokinase [Victivallales bacterium]|nr:ATP-dependent 6-phosphofructokinase [Victivallales bacterium]